MTRRGTLAYYLAAWVIGCFIIAIPYLFATGPFAPSALLLTYFFVLIAGLFGTLGFAFLLRLVTHLLGTHNIWIWTLAGAGISSALIFLGALVSEKQPAAWQSGLALTITTMIFRGAASIRESGFWQAPIDGAATGAVLCLVDRAFARQYEDPPSQANKVPEPAASETKQSPA